jgi:hypothetical protein
MTVGDKKYIHYSTLYYQRKVFNDPSCAEHQELLRERDNTRSIRKTKVQKRKPRHRVTERGMGTGRTITIERDGKITSIRTYKWDRLRRKIKERKNGKRIKYFEQQKPEGGDTKSKYTPHDDKNDDGKQKYHVWGRREKYRNRLKTLSRKQTEGS